MELSEVFLCKLILDSTLEARLSISDERSARFVPSAVTDKL